MSKWNPVGPLTLLLASMCLLTALDAAQSQERWPPWQSYGEAEAGKRAQAKRRARPTQDELDNLNRQVVQLRKAGKLPEALFAAQRALRITEQLHGPDSAATADALTTVADIYFQQGKLAEAEPLLKRSVSIHEKSANKSQVAVSLDRLANLYDRQGRSADALAARGRAHAIRGVAQVPASGRALARRQTSERGIEARRAPAGQPAPPPAAPAPRAQNAPPAEPDAASRPRARAFYRSAPPPEAAARGLEAPAAAPPPPAPSLGEAPRELTRSAHTEAPSGRGAPAAAPPPAANGEPVSRTAETEEQKDWDVVPVFYGTDRETEPNAQRLAFGSERARHLQLGRALVTVPKLHQVPNIERPWALHIPYFNVKIYEEAEDPKKHFTMQEIKKLTKEEFLNLVRERLIRSARFKDQAFVFVHGYNTSFDNAVYRTAQIAYDLEFDGAPFLYSWPSGGGLTSYTIDRESAGASRPYMRAFLETVLKETGARSVNIIAHSMGNQPLLDVLKDIKSNAPEGVAINQVFLAAPDVDLDSFADVAQAIKGLAKGVTLYVASNDRALQVSRNFWGHYRAGDVPPDGPLVLSGVDTIDVTAASTDAFAINHAGYAQNNDLLKDIGELIATGIRPPDLRKLKPYRVETASGAYWRYTVPHTGSTP